MDLENIAMGHFDARTNCLVGNVNEANAFLSKIPQDNILTQKFLFHQKCQHSKHVAVLFKLQIEDGW